MPVNIHQTRGQWVASADDFGTLPVFWAESLSSDGVLEYSSSFDGGARSAAHRKTQLGKMHAAIIGQLGALNPQRKVRVIVAGRDEPGGTPTWREVWEFMYGYSRLSDRDLAVRMTDGRQLA